MPLLDALLAVIAPHNCLTRLPDGQVCGNEGKLVCDWCAPDAVTDLPCRCYKCKRITSDFAVCDRCKTQTRLRHVWIRADYGGNAKELLRLYKYERAQSAVSTIAEMLDEVIPFLHPDTLVVPVPTATSRVRTRGYDHAALLARQIARTRGLMWLRAVTHLSQSRQVGSSRQQRLSQLRDVFVVTKPALVKGRDILVVDDVVTTGSTLEIMAQVLKQAGAKSVNAAAFAQKQ